MLKISVKMRKRQLFILFASVLLCFGSCAKKEANELAHDHEHDHHHHEGHNHGEEDGEGDDIIKLSPEVAKRFSLKTEKAEMRSLGSVVKVGGTVTTSAEGNSVVSAPTSGILTLSAGMEPGAKLSAGALVGTIKAEDVSGGDANRIARVELEAAKTELERVEALYADRLVTLSQYNEAKAAY